MIPQDGRPLWRLRFYVACWLRTRALGLVVVGLRLRILHPPCSLPDCNREAAVVFPVAGQIFGRQYLCRYHGQSAAAQLTAALLDMGLPLP